MTDSKTSPHALTFVLITVLIDMIGLGIIIPVLPRLIADIAHVDIAQASILGGWLFVAYSAMQFLFGPVIGNLSDAFGRRPVLLVSVAGLGIDYALTALAPTIGWLFAGRLIAGLCGASYTTANAFIADITPPEGRAKAFGMIGAAFGIGFIIGPGIGGFLATYGDRAPFYAAAAFSIANVLYGWFVLPETLSRDKRRPFALARANPLGALIAFRRHPVLVGFGAALFLHMLATNVYPAVWAYYTIYRFGWTEWQVGLSLTAFGVVTALVQGGLVGLFIQRFGERLAAVISLFVECVIAIGYGLATQGWMIYALLVIGALQGIAMPAINAMMTRQVDERTQGELQGAISSLMGIAAIIGPALATQLFGLFAGPGAVIELPGAPFFAAAILSVVALWLFVGVPRKA
ncbi:TCR/Tet family MFS transporter [Labrys monachus]|uniref:DHA1 family tetracycline resistance protein-like MFS transporter n=1 Tax=Labrys monachus TaxID=217067 RepID=A0ABU0FK92_9HYPH|nr:TCR/Tet family MFS transporter [Labrys monachus]MDQ0395033.1 DHA1 family tetracycline resistance protein-like MFS transporter [Labrys monachus]